MEVILTPEDVAARLSVSLRTVGSYLRSGKLRGIKMAGRMWRVTESELERFLGLNVSAEQVGKEG